MIHLGSTCLSKKEKALLWKQSRRGTLINVIWNMNVNNLFFNHFLRVDISQTRVSVDNPNDLWSLFFSSDLSLIYHSYNRYTKSKKTRAQHIEIQRFKGKCAGETSRSFASIDFEISVNLSSSVLNWGEYFCTTCTTTISHSLPSPKREEKARGKKGEDLVILALLEQIHNSLAHFFGGVSLSGHPTCTMRWGHHNQEHRRGSKEKEKTKKEQKRDDTFGKTRHHLSLFRFEPVLETVIVTDHSFFVTSIKLEVGLW